LHRTADNREPRESMSQLGRTRLQTKRAREQNESAEAEVSLNADMFASLRACDCVAAAERLWRLAPSPNGGRNARSCCSLQ